MPMCAEKIVEYLFRDSENLSLSLLEWLKVICATMLISNKNFSGDFFKALSAKISTSNADSNLSDEQKKFIMYGALAYMTYADPNQNDTITINDTEYTIEKIALTSGWISAPYYAYGLKSQNTENQSFLIFQGTTFPTDNGFLAGVLADTRPVGAIGTQLYDRGRNKIQEWIECQHTATNQPVKCVGQSLGGAMSLHAYINQPDKVSFCAINPPYLTAREKTILGTSTSMRTTNNQVLSAIQDPVRGLGWWLPDECRVFSYGESDEYPILAHARAPKNTDGTGNQYSGPAASEQSSISRLIFKYIKPILYCIALLLTALALPIRICWHLGEIMCAKINSWRHENNQQSSDLTL